MGGGGEFARAMHGDRFHVEEMRKMAAAGGRGALAGDAEDMVAEFETHRCGCPVTETIR